MNCSGPGATHWMACDCREDAICKEVAGLRERLAASEKAREEAERERDRAAQIATKEAVIASSALSRATAAESRAADEERQRTEAITRICGAFGITSALQLAALAERDDETTLDLIVKLIDRVHAAKKAAESRAARLFTALEHLLKAFLMLHRACGTGSAEQWPEVEDARAAIAAEREERGKEKGK